MDVVKYIRSVAKKSRGGSQVANITEITDVMETFTEQSLRAKQLEANASSSALASSSSSSSASSSSSLDPMASVMASWNAASTVGSGNIATIEEGSKDAGFLPPNPEEILAYEDRIKATLDKRSRPAFYKVYHRLCNMEVPNATSQTDTINGRLRMRQAFCGMQGEGKRGKGRE
eukprot:TRINITY_DN1192_c0_g1_i6.p1 TRINITY_DN1192_c0_g1~~TRINITY_DN1192_c0_g1_i6.p1  ORF type:complete len:174 (-),score=70.01 TRINITY_DN1192_c0_g1_i6:13-534(-)